MFLKKGISAVNIVTDRWLEVAEDIELTDMNTPILMNNGRKYKFSSMSKDKVFIMVEPI